MNYAIKTNDSFFRITCYGFMTTHKSPCKATKFKTVKEARAKARVLKAEFNQCIAYYTDLLNEVNEKMPKARTDKRRQSLKELASDCRRFIRRNTILLSNLEVVEVAIPSSPVLNFI